jgi:hypothetical protein
MHSMFNINDNFQRIKIAIIIAIILGMVTSVFFMVVNKESYSAIYIIPGSIIYNSDDHTVHYAYGVKSSESGKMDYTLDTYVGAALVKTKQFSLKTGEILDVSDNIILPADTQYPSKISIRLTTNTETEEVHFWLK